MNNIESIATVRGYNSLRVRYDHRTATHWGYMHAQQDHNVYRPCFSEPMLNDILSWQNEISRRALVDAQDNDQLSHVVLCSDADVFNLGGDLELFVRLIRAGDRDRLLHYAQLCIEGVFKFQNLARGKVRSIALVQGDALGGGFEGALCCHTIVAEEGVGMGLPEVLFDLFPGMGAFSYLSRRVSPAQAERMMLSGDIYSSEELFRMGVVDVLAPKGEGVAAVEEVIRRNQRIPHAARAMQQVRNMAQPVTHDELMRITEVWVDTAMQLGEKSLRTMERLVRAQIRRNHATETAAVGAV